MGQVVTNVTVNEQGQLVVWFGPCCSEVLTGLVVSSTPTDITVDPVNPDNDPNFVYYACGKAKAIVDAVYGLIEIAFDYADDILLPWQYIGRIQDDFGFDLDNNWLSLLIVSTQLAWVGGARYGDFDIVQERARVQCQLAATFADDNVGVPDSATFESIKALFKANINTINWTQFDQAINAIGTVDMDTIAKFGAGDASANCDCPDVNVPFAGVADAADWKYVFDFRNGLYDFVLSGTGPQHQDSSGLWAENQVTANKSHIYAERAFDNVDNGSTLTQFGMIWRNIGDENYLASGTGMGIEDAAIGETQIVAICGDNPASAGLFQGIWTIINTLGAANLKFFAGLQAEHDTAVQQRIVAIMFAGTGPGPLNTA